MVKALTLEAGHTDPKSSTVRPGVPNSGKQSHPRQEVFGLYRKGSQGEAGATCWVGRDKQGTTVSQTTNQ